MRRLKETIPNRQRTPNKNLINNYFNLSNSNEVHLISNFNKRIESYLSSNRFSEKYSNSSDLKLATTWHFLNHVINNSKVRQPLLMVRY